uniref:Uncharacterized protein n=1 Tax=Strombidinopsis acuminata TaxID=141414 RepID=A0A7S3W3N8_9SPIT|mmetsp:Transcript_11933/g.16370  ORF Transcript_11933/g.16370 Transcript_11933/m.16370 type:complete len:106 (+) Transcript_11933:2-319(+)
MMARLVPHDRKPSAKAAVHIVHNLEASQAGKRIVENPAHHEVVNTSGFEGEDYRDFAEVGCICQMLEDNAGGVIVIPSLETKAMKGKYTLHFMGTEPLDIQRLDS